MPIIRDRVRPFVRAARPYIRDLRPAARNLHRASPDLRAAFFELNRLFNMLAYNPKGTEKLTGDLDADRARDEGYLFWLGWTVHNTVSIMSTGDALGNFRRFNVSASCSTLRGIVEGEPAAEIVLGVTALLKDPGFCPES